MIPRFDTVCLAQDSNLPLDWSNMTSTTNPHINVPNGIQSQHGDGQVTWCLQRDGFYPEEASGVLFSYTGATGKCYASVRDHSPHLYPWRRETENNNGYYPGRLEIMKDKIVFIDAKGVPRPPDVFTNYDWIAQNEEQMLRQSDLKVSPHSWLRVRAELAKDEELLSSILRNSFAFALKSCLIPDGLRLIETGEEVYVRTERNWGAIIADLRCLGESYVDFWLGDPNLSHISSGEITN